MDVLGGVQQQLSLCILDCNLIYTGSGLKNTINLNEPQISKHTRGKQKIYIKNNAKQKSTIHIRATYYIYTIKRLLV